MSGNVVAWVFDRYPVNSGKDRTRKIILSEVAEAANRDFAEAHPGIQPICDHWHLGRSTVTTALSELVADGWLEVTDPGGGRGNATVYRVRREKGQELGGLPEETARSEDLNRAIPETKPRDSEDPLLTVQALVLTQGPPADPVRLVFDAWLSSAAKSGRTLLDAKRRATIERALRDYGLEDVLDAVRGWEHSPWHRGENPESRKYNDLALLLRDGQKIEMFRDLWRNPPPVTRRRGAAPAADEEARRAAPTGRIKL